jgi:hypothetical protein
LFAQKNHQQKTRTGKADWWPAGLYLDAGLCKRKQALPQGNIKSISQIIPLHHLRRIQLFNCFLFQKQLNLFTMENLNINLRSV